MQSMPEVRFVQSCVMHNAHTWAVQLEVGKSQTNLHQEKEMIKLKIKKK